MTKSHTLRTDTFFRGEIVICHPYFSEYSGSEGYLHVIVLSIHTLQKLKIDMSMVYIVDEL